MVCNLLTSKFTRATPVTLMNTVVSVVIVVVVVSTSQRCMNSEKIDLFSISLTLLLLLLFTLAFVDMFHSCGILSSMSWSW